MKTINKIETCENCGTVIKMTAYKIRDARKRGIILCQKCKLSLVMTQEKKEKSLQKQKNTMIVKYGVDNFSKTETFRKSRSGDNNPMKLEKSKQKLKESLANRTKEEIDLSNIKRKKTCLEKYGHECSLQNDEVIKKTKESNLKLYGSENVSNSKIIKEKKEKTFLKHFGVKHGFQSEEVKNKIKETIFLRYGVENPGQINSSKLKKISTCKERYGVEYFFQSKEFFKNKISKIEYDNHTFDSSDEVEFYKLLKEHSAKFEMQKKYPKPYIVDGKEHWTYVDFYLIEDDLWVEIKGKQFFTENWNPIYVYGSKNDIKNNERAAMLWVEKLKFLLQEDVQIIIRQNNKFNVINDVINMG